MSHKLNNIELLFKALADQTRLRLLNLMGDDEVCVCFFVEVLRTSQPKVSRHLAYLKRAGIVSSRRDGKWMHYRIAEPPDENAARVFREVRAWIVQDREMQKDRARLEKVCCAPQSLVNLSARSHTTLPTTLQIAPRPQRILPDS